MRCLHQSGPDACSQLQGLREEGPSSAHPDEAFSRSRPPQRAAPVRPAGRQSGTAEQAAWARPERLSGRARATSLSSRQLPALLQAEGPAALVASRGGCPSPNQVAQRLRRAGPAAARPRRVPEKQAATTGDSGACRSQPACATPELGRPCAYLDS
jgi:hypothetical protein